MNAPRERVCGRRPCPEQDAALLLHLVTRSRRRSNDGPTTPTLLPPREERRRRRRRRVDVAFVFVVTTTTTATGGGGGDDRGSRRGCDGESRHTHFFFLSLFRCRFGCFSLSLCCVSSWSVWWRERRGGRERVKVECGVGSRAKQGDIFAATWFYEETYDTISSVQRVNGVRG